MSYFKPSFRHPELPRNSLSYTKADYEGPISTLCAGCGHDSISGAIVQACFELSLPPHKIAKLSGIGCSSKTPSYFLRQSHGFNSVHGRMPSVATGANMANRDLTYIGVSGDGDSASIGFGQFAHVARRNLNMLYLVENNGCYGLTKGQDSATADVDSISKAGSKNPYAAIDLVSIALQLGATFVARSFSGDKKQLVTLLKAAIAHPGFSFIDVVSPCVTFNNNAGSTKAYDYVREHLEATSALDFVPEKEEITTNYSAGSSKTVTLHDGSKIYLQKLEKEWDPTNRKSAMNMIATAASQGEILTGLVYVDAESSDFPETIQTSTSPLNSLKQKHLCPGNLALASINEGLR